jgi:DNA-binding HxlR family transcriptional regulator
MAAMDLLGRRWALRLLWELRDRPVGARALLVQCPGLSSSVLYDRLRELAAADLLQKTDGDQYELTAIGRSLSTALTPLDDWAKKWAKATSKKA